MVELPGTVEVIESELALGRSPGAQLCVWRDGAVVVDAGFGEARDGVAMRNDSVVLWLSAGKPITAVVVMQLVAEGVLSLDDRVADYLPAFGQHGKDGITVRHVLTHTGGFRFLPGSEKRTWAQTLERINGMKLPQGWKVGQTAGYDPAGGWFVLGELVQRVTGEPIERVVSARVFERAGMRDCYLGVPEGEQRGLGDRLAGMYLTPRGKAESVLGEDSSLRWVSRRSPGSSVCGPVRELARFYGCLLEEGGALLDAASVRAMVSRQREGLADHTFGAVIDWGLGVILNSAHHQADYPYGFGPYASRETYGHGGRQAVMGYCDPVNRLVVAWAFNGQPGEPAHHERNTAMNRAVYEDLGLG